MSRYLDLARGGSSEGAKCEISEISPVAQTPTEKSHGRTTEIQKNTERPQPHTEGQRVQDKARTGTDCEISPAAQTPKTDDLLGFGVNSLISQFACSQSGYARVLTTLEARCLDLVPLRRWRRAVEDGKRFLAQWGKQAAAFGWTARDLFGLHQPPARPHPSYSRLSRRDCTGLIWLLQGRRVVALTAETAAIENPSGAVTLYRRDPPHIVSCLRPTIRC